MTSSIYPPWANTLYRCAIGALVLGVVSLIAAPMLYARTPYNTSQFVPWEQPVEFDHRHHVRDDGIDCLYCHSAAERSASAGVPTTALCMGCHTQIYNDSPLLEPVRRSYFAGTPINWKRVHDLPDHVYFNHAVHVTRGIACDNCHGDVSQMPRVVQVQPMTMGWCVDCHRDSVNELVPRDIPANTWEASLEMMSDWPSDHRDLTALITCSACHR